MSLAPPDYHVRAVNTAPDSENRIHDDHVAAQYGFRGGLVPGVTVYGYMMRPVIEFAPHWRARGSMHVVLAKPVYEGDEITVKIAPQDDGTILVLAQNQAGTLCAHGPARFPESAHPSEEIPAAALPAPDERPALSRDLVAQRSVLGTVETTLETADPAELLQLSNDILVRNFRFGPWLHVASEVRNWSDAQAGEPVSARGRIQSGFEQKGHEFLVAEVMLLGAGGRLLQTVRHTAIYRLRAPAS